MSARIDRQAAFTGTREVPEGLAFDVGRLEAYLGKTLESFRGPLAVRQFRGGQSNPTYLLEASSGHYVLRRKPPGKLLPSAHAVDREYRVISALYAQGFPVPRPYLLCEDEDVIGTVFYVMERVSGRVFWEPYLPDLQPRDRASIYQSMNEAIARLHATDITTAGLADFGKPEGYVARQIRRWSQQYQASRTDDVPEMERLMEWLPDAVPDQTGTAIVHGDYRLDNLIIARDEPRVVAVLDWELATLGDPVGDFTYHLMTWHMPPAPDGAGIGSLVGHDLDSLGIPGIEPYIEAYCARTGRDFLPDIDFYFAYNFFRLAAILQGIVGRVREGTASNENAAAMAGQVRPLARTAWQFAERAGVRS